jgi:hypothetical protein
MHARFVFGVVAFLAAVTGGAAWLTSPAGAPGASTAEALSALLAAQGIDARPQDVLAVDAPPRGPLAGVGFTRFVALGRRAGASEDDVWALLARTTPWGRVLALTAVTDLSRSAGAEESALVVAGGRVAYAVVTDRGTEAITVLDFAGEEPALTRGFSAFARVASAITNVQRTGQPQGLSVRRFELATVAPGVVAPRLEGAVLRAELPEGSLVVDLPSDRVLEGAALAHLLPSAKGRPQLIGWTVDTLRAVSWIGPRRIEWLEHKAFLARDVVQRAVHRFAPDASDDDIARDMGLGAPTAPRAERHAAVAAPPPVWASERGGARMVDETTVSATGWPPENLTPLDLPNRYESEGVWAPLEGDEVVPGRPGAPPLFVTTWLRADRDRQYARAYVVAWDPRAVELKIRAGASEPVDETGASGTGQIPRDPATLRRLVGAFNGGFQAIHGEWGLAEEGHEYLPPKPWAATVAELADGSVGFGTWPEEQTEVPEDVVAYRQNLTPLVADGRFNPYGRSWWGAAPPQAPDQVHTVRTGVCLMQDGFVAYLWGNDLSHEALGNAMQVARCEYGIHLDMNMGLCGFELYRVFERGTVAALDRSLERDFEAEGDVEDAPGLAYRARRLTRSMNSMNFPRHIGREGRDFFYLLARPRLPGPDLAAPIAPARDGEGRWSVLGLPHNGYPWAFARTFVRPLAARPDAVVWMLRIDPSRVQTGGEQPGALALGAFVPGPGGASLALGVRGPALAGPPLTDDAAARAGMGLDPEGLVVIAEGPGREAVLAALALAGVHDARALGDGGHVELGLADGRAGLLDGATSAPTTTGALVLWAASDTPEGRRLFAEVPFAPPRVWQARQGQRVRYFKGRR